MTAQGTLLQTNGTPGTETSSSFSCNYAVLLAADAGRPNVSLGCAGSQTSPAFPIDTPRSDHYVRDSKLNQRPPMRTYFAGFYFFYTGFDDPGGP